MRTTIAIAVLASAAVLSVPSIAVAQGVGPTEGPLPAGLPAEDAVSPWILQADLRGAFALGERVIGMNRLPLNGDDEATIGSRFLLSGKVAFGRQIDSRVIKGIFGFGELISTHGRNTDITQDAWSTEQVAWGTYAGAGILLPRGWWAYVEGQGHWSLADEVEGGPYEIYNMVLAGRGFDMSFGAADEWFLEGFFEGGICFSHNEVSVNLRRFDQPETDFFGDTYGRYAVRGSVQFGTRLSHQIVREISVYVKPYFIFGRTIPQQDYTWAADYIGSRRSFGAQVTLGDGIRVFGEYQATWHFGDQLAIPGTGPYESYFVLGVSKVFDLAALVQRGRGSS